MLRDFADWFKVMGLVLAYAAVTLFMALRADAQELRAAPFQTYEASYGDQTLREGVHAQVGELRGCVVYLEGLGDSILNHEPLFRALAGAGYRTLSFDYFGQGGSSGSMSDTRVEDAMKPFVEIGNQARFIWNRHPECYSSKKFVIGWSTGGLAAFKLAVEKWADGVVLLAPGLYPKTFVGEAAHNSSLIWKVISMRGGWPEFFPVISLRSLTRDLNRSGAHVDGVKPTSPTAVLPFAKNLIFTSMLYRSATTDVPGLALLSGDEDTYVDRVKSEKMFKNRKKLPHFDVHVYPGALHELDNEIEPVRLDVQKRTIEFFNQLR
jgi:alpha-beta hydrolase superfamily lysophospholipase